MKNYILSKTTILGIPVEKINYNFQVQDSPTPTKFNKIVIHHTGKNKTINQIIKNHIIKKKYSSIGYHFMIGKTGKIYYSRNLKYAGAHTYGYNKNGIGIALFGDFNEDKPSQKQLESLKRLITNLKNKYSIKYLFAHNEAIYKQIKQKFWKLNLPNINPIEISTKLSYDGFQKEVTTKILENDTSENTISLIKKLKSCPGYNMYPIIVELKKEFKKIKIRN